jgi:predicted nucleic acid-binding protein
LSLVLDSSATLAWIYAEETTQDIREVFDTVTEGRAFVPSLWRLEVANSLTGAMRRGRIGAEFRRAALADLAFLDIIVDDQTDSNAWGETLALADRGAAQASSCYAGRGNARGGRGAWAAIARRAANLRRGRRPYPSLTATPACAICSFACLIVNSPKWKIDAASTALAWPAITPSTR